MDSLLFLEVGRLLLFFVLRRSLVVFALSAFDVTNSDDQLTFRILRRYPVI